MNCVGMRYIIKNSETYIKILTADDADFADLTLIFIRLIKKEKSALNQQNQRHQRFEINLISCQNMSLGLIMAQIQSVL
jgi:hypothetical protein